MTTISFTIVAGAILLGLMVIMALTSKFEPTVKAGKANDFRWRYSLLPDVSSRSIKCGTEIIDTSVYKTFKTKGGSMSYNGINPNHRIFVKPFSNDNEKNDIHTHPVVMITLTAPRRILDSRFKLRKFIDYVSPQTANWKNVYDKNLPENRIKVPFKDFEDSMKEKCKSDEIKNVEKCVLSETYNEKKCKYEYSLHPVNLLYGKVMFVE